MHTPEQARPKTARIRRLRWRRAAWIEYAASIHILLPLLRYARPLLPYDSHATLPLLLLIITYIIDIFAIIFTYATPCYTYTLLILPLPLFLPLRYWYVTHTPLRCWQAIGCWYAITYITYYAIIISYITPHIHAITCFADIILHYCFFPLCQHTLYAILRYYIYVYYYGLHYYMLRWYYCHTHYYYVIADDIIICRYADTAKKAT